MRGLRGTAVNDTDLGVDEYTEHPPRRPPGDDPRAGTPMPGLLNNYRARPKHRGVGRLRRWLTEPRTFTAGPP